MYFKHLKSIVFFAFFLILTNGPAFAQQQRNVQECREDSDCIFVGNACAMGAVNKRFKIKAENFVKGVDREMKSCDGKDETITPNAYCQRQEVECRNPSDRKKGKKCYTDKGICTPKY